MNKTFRNILYLGIGGCVAYIGYSFYKRFKDNEVEIKSLEDLLNEANVQIDPTTGDIADGQLDPDIFDVPDILVNDNVDVFTDINLNNYQEALNNADKVTINLNTDENVVEGFGQTNFDYEGLINSEAGEIVHFTNQFIQVDIHNQNNFEFWFVISNISCLQGYGSLYAFNIYRATNMQPIAPITYNSNIIGYQFTDVGIVFVEIIIACESNYGELLDPIQLSFYLDVGNYTNSGGSGVPQDWTPNQVDLLAYENTNKE